MLKEIPLTIKADNILDLMNSIKRRNINSGPYPNVALFEAANRIMTDLVILNGVKMLLDGKIKEIDFDDYYVEYGNENQNAHDITAQNNGKNLRCEAFNVSAAFFHTKKAKTLKKLRNNAMQEDIILVMFNKDAVSTEYQPKKIDKEYYLLVEI